MSDKNLLSKEILQLIHSMHSLNMATLSPQGQPEVSYSPYLYSNGIFFIFVSRLATHTNNLLRSPGCSIMLIEDEKQADNIHARKRLILQCSAQTLDLASTESQSVLDQMEKKLGNTLNLTRKLPDFVLFSLITSGGRYIKGFGAAYQINKELAVTHLLTGN